MKEISKGLRLMRMLKQLKDGIKQNMEVQFKEMNLTGPQGMLIGTLAHSGEVKISDLSEKLGLSNSAVSGMMDRLEKQGLVERIRSQEDRRVVFVRVTPEFTKNAQEYFNKIERRFEDMMNAATPEEAEAVLKGLDTLQRLLERQKK